MNHPNYKPTKWELYTCTQCKYTAYRVFPWCTKQNHFILQHENKPFLVEEFKIETSYGKGWWKLKSIDREGLISATKFEEVVRGCGIYPGGYIRNQWWMFRKVGSALTLVWLPNDV